MSALKEPWISRHINEKAFLLKYEFTKESYSVYFCDLTAVYEEVAKSTDVIQRNLELNPNIETDQDKLLSIIKSCLESPALKIESQNKESIHLETYVSIGGMKFVWSFSTKLCQPEVFREMLFSPLLGMTFQLMKRQDALIDCIKNKDAEIEDYKDNGAKVTRAYLETEKFCEDHFLSSNNIIQADDNEVWKTVFNKLGLALLKSVAEAVPVNHVLVICSGGCYMY